MTPHRGTATISMVVPELPKDKPLAPEVRRSRRGRVFCWDPSLCVESIRSLEDRVLDWQKNAWKRNDDWAAREAKGLIARGHERGGQVTWRDVAFLLRAAEGRKLMRRMTTMVIVGERGR